jgi:hypothetical protein
MTEAPDERRQLASATDGSAKRRKQKKQIGIFRILGYEVAIVKAEAWMSNSFRSAFRRKSTGHPVIPGRAGIQVSAKATGFPLSRHDSLMLTKRETKRPLNH